MMIRLGASTALLVLLGACGSGSADSAAEEQGPAASATPTAAAAPVHVGEGDNEKVNTAFEKVWEAGRTAADADAQKKCGKAPTEKWAACWHGLLDPVQAALGDVADELEAFAGTGYSATGCATAITGARTTFTDFETDVKALAAGIDSDGRAAQEKSMKDYMGVLTEIAEGYAAPFKRITSACYSPADVARANASPSPGA